jgi:uncharacterized membrane protein
MALGPVQLMVIAFDEPHFDGSVVEEINRLSEAGIVRLLDAMVVDKADDGTVTTVEITELDAEEMIELGATIGGLIGLGAAGEDGMVVGAALGAEAAAEDGHVIGDFDIIDVLDEVPNGAAAAIVLLEHVWAIPLSQKIEAVGGEPLIDMWVHPLELVALGAVMGAED